MKEGSLQDVRVMVSGLMGMALPYNNAVSELIESCANAMAPESLEVNSSDHLMYKLDRMNDEIEKMEGSEKEED